MKRVVLLCLLFLPVFVLEAVSQETGYQGYSANGKLLDSVYIFTWSKTGSQWNNTSRTYVQKDVLGRIVNSREIIYDSVKGAWRNSRQDNFSYTGPGTEFTSKTSLVWNTNTNYWMTYQYIHKGAKGLIDTLSYKYWDEKKHTFLSGYRLLDEYDGNGNLTVRRQQLFDTISVFWLNSFKTTNTYNVNSQILEELNQNWNVPNSAWVNQKRASYTYDSINRLINYSDFQWDDLQETWLNNQRKSYSGFYANQPQLTLIEMWNPLTELWYNTGKFEDAYTIYGQKTNEMQFVFDTVAQQWEEFYLAYWIYYSDGTVDELTENNWNPLALTWINDHYLKNDSLGRMKEEFFMNYNPLTYEITGGNRTVTSYDPASGGVASTLVQQWDISTGNWINQSQTAQLYDPQNLLLETLVLAWDPVSGWGNKKKTLYYYSEPGAINDPTQYPVVCFYENPMVYGKEISCPELKPAWSYKLDLVSISGKLVFSRVFRGGEKVLLDRNFSAGMYLLRLTQNGKMIFSGKVIVPG